MELPGPLTVRGDLTIGEDISLYRSGTATLRTDATFIVGDSAVLKFGPDADVNLYRAGADMIGTDSSYAVGGALQHWGSTAGFFGTAAIVRPEVTGSRGDGSALTSLLTALAFLGLITDSTTA